jgi:hypothetical protein
MGWRDHLKIHPACNLLPAMTPEELRALSDDIKANTLQERANLIRDGDGYALLDGRSRLDALEAIGPIQVFDGSTPNRKFFEVIEVEDPFAYVMSVNFHRRHLTAEHKRDVVSKLLKARPELSDRAIASATKVDHKTVAPIRAKLEHGGEIPHHRSRVGRDGVQQSVTWPRARKVKPAAPGTGRKHRSPAIETTHKDIRPRLPLERSQVSMSLEPALSAPDGKTAPTNQPVEAAPPPDPIRLHVAAVIGAVAALDRLPDNFDFNRMASIVDVRERPHLRGRVSRGMDALNALWDALGDAIEPPALAEEDPQPDIIDDLSSVEITEKMPPLPG